MSWDQFTRFDDLTYIEQLRDAIWERIVAVRGAKGFTLPRTFVPAADQILYDTAPPVGTTHWLLMGKPDYSLGTALYLPFLNDYSVQLWTVEYPYEINVFPSFAESYNAVARFIYKEGVSPPETKALHCRTFKWFNEWTPTNDQVTILKRLRKPKVGDYMGHLWKRWLTLISNLKIWYVTVPDLTQIPYAPPRFWPREAPPGIYQDPKLNAAIFENGVRRKDLFNPDILTAVGPPQTGDYVRPLLVTSAIDVLKRMRYTADFPLMKGKIRTHTESNFFPWKNSDTIQDFDGNGPFPGSGSYDVIYNIFNPQAERDTVTTVSYVDGQYYNPRLPFVPIQGTYHPLIKFHSQMTRGLGTFQATHNFLGKDVYIDVNGSQISGSDFTPSFNDFVPDPNWFRAPPYEYTLTNSIQAKGFTEWFFTNV